MAVKNTEIENLKRFPLVEADRLSADDVARRRAEFGLNQVTPRRGTPPWMRFLEQFNQALAGTLVTYGQAEGAMPFGGRHVEIELEQII